MRSFRSTPPSYLIKIIRFYLTSWVRLDLLDLFGGVTQGSVLGLTLWNSVYDYLLNSPLGEGTQNTQLIGFGDELALVASFKDTAVLETKINDMQGQSKNWHLSTPECSPKTSR